MLRGPFLLLLFACAHSTMAQPLVLKNQRELFVDDVILDKLNNLELRLGTPVSAGKAIDLDEPWEGNYGAYVTVLRADDKYRMYYRGQGGGANALSHVTCYAESPDGIHWIKPRLNLYTIAGHETNNVVMAPSAEQSTHNLAVLYDNRPGVPGSERFKAVGGVASSVKRPKRGLYRYVSADGIHWRKYKDSSALFTDGYAMDSQNVLAWVPAENKYAIYLRVWTNDKPGDTSLLKGVRTIARSVSDDFIHWSKPVRMDFGDTPLEDLYTNATQSYFRAPQIMIAMPFRFSPNARVLSDSQMLANGIDRSMWQGVSDGVLLTSRGGNKYDRKFMESFVRPGPDPRNWAARSNIPSLGIVQTGPSEMSFFVTRAYSTNDCYLERMKMRIDGFSSLHAGYKEGTALTHPLVLNGNNFLLNYSTSSVGYVKVVITDKNGKEIPGFGAADAPPIVGDLIDAGITWKSGKTIRELSGKTVRIKFISRDADIYSFAVTD